MENLLILHGALGNKSQFTHLAGLLDGSFHVHLLDFSGHQTEPYEGTFSMEVFVNDVTQYLNAHAITRSHFFGYSMGGYVALNLALAHPSKVGKIVTLATKFNWTSEIASREAGMLDAEEIELKFPGFAQGLKGRFGPGNWKSVVSNTAQLLLSLGNGKALRPHDLKSISNDVLILIGSEDKMVSMEESKNAAHLLPHGNLNIIPEGKHQIETFDVNLLARLIKDFTTGRT